MNVQRGFLLAFLSSFFFMNILAQERLTPPEADKLIDSMLTSDNSDKSRKVRNEKTLNLIYGKILEDYFSLSSTPSPQQLSAFLNSTNNSFEVGYSINHVNGDLLKYLDQIFYVGFKLIGSPQKSFFTIFESGEFSNNIGLDVRYTKMLNINSIFRRLKKPSKEKLSQLEKIHRILSSYRKPYLKLRLKNEIMWQKQNMSREELTIAAEYYMTENEAEFALENDSLIGLHKAWLTIEAFVPITNTSYQITQEKTPFDELSLEFRNWSAGLSLNNLFIMGKQSAVISMKVKVFNNNNILTGDINQRTFTKVDSTINGEFVSIDEKSLYVGKFADFLTQQLNLEFTSLFLGNESIGLSAALEKNFSTEYDALNWKLGIPLSLKDSKGNNTINFEIQWREINKRHSVGVSIGKSFGKFAR